MLEEFEIRKKWREICQRDRPKGCIIDSGAFAVELVRWVERGLTPRAADGARFCPECHALLEDQSVYCDTCGTDTPRR